MFWLQVILSVVFEEAMNRFGKVHPALSEQGSGHLEPEYFAINFPSTLAAMIIHPSKPYGWGKFYLWWTSLQNYKASAYPWAVLISLSSPFSMKMSSPVEHRLAPRAGGAAALPTAHPWERGGHRAHPDGPFLVMGDIRSKNHHGASLLCSVSSLSWNADIQLNAPAAREGVRKEQSWHVARKVI